jgi:magnesium chelatase family protein
MSTKDLDRYCKLQPVVNNILKNAMDRLGLSARAYDRILKVARTIADLDNEFDINAGHISEAIQFRSLDRNSWSN